MPSSFKGKHGEHALSNTSMEMDEESLADIRKENAIKTRCVTFGVNYIERRQDETAAEKEQRHITFKANDRERRKRARAQQSPEECRSTQDANTVARKQEKSTAVA